MFTFLCGGSITQKNYHNTKRNLNPEQKLFLHIQAGMFLSEASSGLPRNVEVVENLKGGQGEIKFRIIRTK